MWPFDSSYWTSTFSLLRTSGEGSAAIIYENACVLHKESSSIYYGEQELLEAVMKQEIRCYVYKNMRANKYSYLKQRLFSPPILCVFKSQIHLCNDQIHKEFEHLSTYTVRDLLFLFQFSITKNKVIICQQVISDKLKEQQA